MASKVAIVECNSYESNVVAYSVEKAINLLGGINQFVKPQFDVLLKPNLCLPSLPDECLTTHPEVVRHIARLCRNAGSSVTIGDSPVGKTDKKRTMLVWERTGMEKVAKELECSQSNLDGTINIFNYENDGKNCRLLISEEVFKMNYIINVPKFKTHSLMTFTGSVKNLFGLLPENIKKWLHREMPDKDEFAALLVNIYDLVRPGLHIMDAVVGIQGEGPGAKGERRKIGLIMASTDAIALDSVAAKLMNLQPDTIPTNRVGKQKQLGESDLEKIEILGEPIQKYIMEDFKLPITYRYNQELTKKIFGMECLYIEINHERCRKCNLCLLNCPAKAISINDNKLMINKNNCISCLICHEICPEGAIDFKSVTYVDQLTRIKAKGNEKKDVNV